MNGLLKPLETTPEFISLQEGLDKDFRRQLVLGLSASQKSYVMAGLIEAQQQSALILTSSEQEAGLLTDDLKELLPGTKILSFPVWQLLPYQVLAHSKEVLRQRLEVLKALCQEEKLVIIAPVEALLRRLSPYHAFCRASLCLEVGQIYDLKELKEKLAAYGYERVDPVEGHGQYSVRGGILDVYPMTSSRPVRIEFFDDEVDSIRLFEPNTQRSVENLRKVEIFPAREMIVETGLWQLAYKRIVSEYQKQKQKLSQAGAAEALQNISRLEEVLDYINHSTYFEGIEQYLPYFYEETVSLLDFFNQNSLVLIDEPVRVKESVEAIHRERAETYADLLRIGRVLPLQYKGYLNWSELYNQLELFRTVFFSFLPRQSEAIKPQKCVNFPVKAMQGFFGKINLLVEALLHWKKAKYRIVLLVNSIEKAKQLTSALKDHQIDAYQVKNIKQELQPGKVIVTGGHLTGGFEFTSGKLVVITELEMYGQRKKPSKQRQRVQDKIELFADLKTGDYVVHVNHGIGRYEGIVQLTIGEVKRDYLLVKYAGEDKLYVPTDQVEMIQKYLGSEAGSPKLSRLGGAEWSRVKSKVKEAVKEMAQELLALYATRETISGHAFSKDTVWQQEFEAAFPYDETPDQLRAIDEVKADMERARPMDRLLCGDVGYGKTEVALRAAFKAVMDSKQVAVLVPTTILAQQHYNTFQERFAKYPVSIAMLSRFRTPREQRRIIQELAEGRVDIVIGTHRLVQDDIRFKDLGLLVVDEEQRFGVSHKEKLKQMRENVDVLTLTATPIPRTLHMSLVGVRDTSLLETPPEDRFPVQTYVLEEEAVIIREAIRRELGRGGQVYYVHNRVADLDQLAAWVTSLVPESKVAVAHGQMKEDRLERVMLDFMSQKYNVLVCTTIIETGLDIPNVNTLIVKEADHMGLAQLYQLRGRVGRTNRLAYAYFTFRRDRVLSEVAEKRLAAVREFTAFGSGYKIAMRDLEIRGAGNILGPEQHGHIAAVGFDLYCRLLEDAVREAKGGEEAKLVDTVVELPVTAYIPDEYVPDTSQKVELYKRMANVSDVKQLSELEDELIDRFGDLPEAVVNLLVVARIKTYARNLKIKGVSRLNGFYRLQFAQGHNLTGEKLVKLSERMAGKVRFSNVDGEFEIRLKSIHQENETRTSLSRLEDFLHKLT
ncbi:transcription-repair coupling factor [Desulfolucanica intricata]|uniref:transcription-repair coupling factor n=1 Tax=Desulfolucanica intricata TaxID=1285191 RepID=UPI0008340660|nr:transcription-repair coupling factor [Desulfolucanica intricata]